VGKQVINGNKTILMAVLGFLCVSLGSSTVQLHDSLRSRSACANSEAGLGSENGEVLKECTTEGQCSVGGEWSASRLGRFTPGGRGPRTHWIGGWVDTRAGLVNVEKREFLTLPGLEPRPIGHPPRSQSLYRLSYPGSSIQGTTTEII
jgi:hypothetical protein